MRRVALIVLVTALAAAGAAAVARSATPELVGSVGPGFGISLKANGADVTHLDPGTYTLVIHDLAAEHNFHLTGPGVDVATGVDTIGDQTSTITLTDGVYHFQCDAHATVMKGVFAVGTATLPAAPVVKPTPKPKPKPKPKKKKKTSSYGR